MYIPIHEVEYADEESSFMRVMAFIDWPEFNSRLFIYCGDHTTYFVRGTAEEVYDSFEKLKSYMHEATFQFVNANGWVRYTDDRPGTK